jgi:hypothetical protein
MFRVCTIGIGERRSLMSQSRPPTVPALLDLDGQDLLLVLTPDEQLEKIAEVIRYLEYLAEQGRLTVVQHEKIAGWRKQLDQLRREREQRNKAKNRLTT